MGCLKKTFNDFTGRTQQRKARDRQHTAQVKLNEAKHYKSLLEGNISTSYKNLQNTFTQWS